jgi:hypothetical protein
MTPPLKINKKTSYALLLCITLAAFILALSISFYHHHANPTEYAKCNLCQLKARVQIALPITIFSVFQILYALELAEPRLVFVSQYSLPNSLERAPPAQLA